jgi:hypothetical protein
MSRMARIFLPRDQRGNGEHEVERGIRPQSTENSEEPFNPLAANGFTLISTEKDRPKTHQRLEILPNGK